MNFQTAYSAHVEEIQVEISRLKTEITRLKSEHHRLVMKEAEEYEAAGWTRFDFLSTYYGDEDGGDRKILYLFHPSVELSPSLLSRSFGHGDRSCSTDETVFFDWLNSIEFGLYLTYERS